LEVINRLQTIFSDERGGILFSSVHRAKGMEHTDCYIIEPNQMPFKSSRSWQFQQECNLAYVAFTRSLARMTFVEGRPNMSKLCDCNAVTNEYDDSVELALGY
jgi:superfamily I DNA and RNA helicase